MNTQRMVNVLCILAISGSLFLVYLKSGQLEELRLDLAEEVAKGDSQRRRVQELRTLIAERDRKVAEAASQEEFRLPRLSAKTITKRLVDSLYAEAKQLEKAGEYREALAKYLWCYDATGLVDVSGYGGVRNSFLLSRILRFGEHFPGVLDGLRERRDEAEKQIRSGSEKGNAVATFASINRKLGDTERSFALYDDSELDEKEKRSLRIYLRNDFIEAQRYEDATKPGVLGLSLASFDRSMNRTISDRFDEEKAEEMREANKAKAVAMAAKNIEALVGAGELDDALALATHVLKTDASRETIAVLESHFERAGQEGILARLLKEMESE